MSELVLAGARPAASRLSLPVTLRIAWRDLRAGLRGFWIFLACLALGVAAITGIGSLSSSIMDGLRREGRVILGADLSFSLIHREAEPAERGVLACAQTAGPAGRACRGTVTTIAVTRAMARTEGGDATVVELKAVEPSYPVIGTLETEPALPGGRLFAQENGLFGAAVDPILLARLGLKVGDRLILGTLPLDIRAEIRSEPDKIAVGVGFGPRLMVSIEALRASGLVQPGSLVRWVYRVTMPDGTTDAQLAERIEAVEKAAPEAGWRIRSRLEASPEIGRNIGRFTQFMALVALSALVVGGVGVANAVRAFVDRKRATIAILKSVGATGGGVFRICLAEVLTLAALGIAIGLVVGAALPFLVAWGFGAILPVPLEPAIHAGDLLLGAVYGFATALAFAIWPLGRAHDVRVSALFRDEVDPEAVWPRWPYIAATVAAVAALVAVAIGFAWDATVAAITVAATAAAFVLLRVVALGVTALAARLPRPRRTELRLALANIHRPGSLTPSLVLSLGLGVALLVTLAQIDGNLRRELTRALPGRAPSFFFLDVANADAARFDALLAREAPEGKIERVPMMRGRLVSLKGQPVETIKAPERFAWVLEGDRGLTYADAMPAEGRLAAGAWWPADYRGPPLVSFDAEIGAALGLEVGDKLVVNILGRNIEATVANLRRIEWRSLGINFVMVFSPNTFAGAPHTHLATLALPAGGTVADEARILKAVGAAYPAVTAVRVKDQLEAFNSILDKLVAAIRGASSIAILASLLVLAGALAAGHRARLYDAVILKTLGATRLRLIAAFALEYGMLGVITALFGVFAGTAAAWVIVTEVMRLSFAVLPLAAAGAAIAAVVVTVVLGLLGTWRILGEKVAPWLRHL